MHITGEREPNKILKVVIIARFILIALGRVGRHSDGGIFSNSSFGRGLEDRSLLLPGPSPLPGTSEPVP